MLWFDAHLDLACLAVNGRDMLAPPESAGGPWPPASITLPSLRDGNVRVALATIFTERDGKEWEGGYPAGDAEAAHKRGRAQLEVYETWRDQGHVAIDLRQLLRHDPGVGRVRAGMGVGSFEPHSLRERIARADRALRSTRSSERWADHAPLHIGILMENADPIRSPDELAWWKERGLVAIGLTWARSSRYAMGNLEPMEEKTGLTDLGRAMVKAMDALGIVHDLSHLSDRAMDELLSLTDRPVIASHSNCRAILNDPANQRHLRDESIREITRRGGVIGLNLCRNFIAPQPYSKGDPRPSIEQSIAHIEHVCSVAGNRADVGLGSDMDGGFGGEDLPEGIDLPMHLTRLAEALSRLGWDDDEIEGFAHENWAGFFARFLARETR